MNRILLGLLLCVLTGMPAGFAQDAPKPAPATAPAQTDKLPFVHVDLAKKRVVVECEALGVTAPLEFLCVMAGTNEHESLLRTKAKPSHIHLGFLMLGMEPGQPVRFSPATDKWLPPQGPPLQISVEFEQNGRTISVPAWKLMREIQSKKTMPPRIWIFVGSKVYNTGQYAADITGYVVSLVNFDLSLIDVPWLATSSNELLEYEMDPGVTPKPGTKVNMILEPAGQAANPTNQPASNDRVAIDQVKLDRLRDQWKREVAARAGEMQQAAAEHYRIIRELRAEQNRLVDEAERIGRMIDELEKDYQNMTVPRPTTQKAQ